MSWRQVLNLMLTRLYITVLQLYESYGLQVNEGASLTRVTASAAHTSCFVKIAAELLFCF